MGLAPPIFDSQPTKLAILPHSFLAQLQLSKSKSNAKDLHSQTQRAAVAAILQGMRAFSRLFAAAACVSAVWAQAADRPETSEPLWMDVQWVLQGRSIKFDGFFTELLGFSEALASALPMLSLVKSSFKDSLQESNFDANSTLLEELFPKERQSIDKLLSPQFPIASVEDIRPPKSLFAEEPSFAASCGAEPAASNESFALGGLLAKPLAQTSTSSECCRLCASIPHCTAWSFAPGPHSCTLSGATPATLGIQPATEPHVQGKMALAGTENVASRHRLAKPRALILHGTTCVWQNETLTRKRDINTILIGRVMVERSTFSHGLTLGDFAVSYCTSIMDELWVPTKWHQDVFAKLLAQYGVSTQQIVIVPEAVDTELFDPAVADANQELRTPVEEGGSSDRDSGEAGQLLLTDVDGQVHPAADSKPFVFLSIFKWEERKGWDILLKAYFTAFAREDSVLLLIHSFTPPPFNAQANLAEVIENFAIETVGRPLSELPAVHVVDDLKRHCPMLPISHSFNRLYAGQRSRPPSVDRAGLSRLQVRALYALSDAFVLPTRGEGWGLPIAEAMSMALPVIVTNYSGPTAYLTADNSYPLDVEPNLDEMSYAIPKEAHLVDLMRQVVLDSNRSACRDCRSDPPATPVIGCVYADLCAIRPDLSIAKAKGLRARQKMQEFNASSIVRSMQSRLRAHAERRGWKL